MGGEYDNVCIFYAFVLAKRFCHEEKFTMVGVTPADQFIYRRNWHRLGQRISEIPSLYDLPKYRWPNQWLMSPVGVSPNQFESYNWNCP